MKNCQIYIKSNPSEVYTVKNVENFHMHLVHDTEVKYVSVLDFSGWYIPVDSLKASPFKLIDAYEAAILFQAKYIDAIIKLSFLPISIKLQKFAEWSYAIRVLLEGYISIADNCICLDFDTKVSLSYRLRNLQAIYTSRAEMFNSMMDEEAQKVQSSK